MLFQKLLEELHAVVWGAAVAGIMVFVAVGALLWVFFLGLGLGSFLFFRRLCLLYVLGILDRLQLRFLQPLLLWLDHNTLTYCRTWCLHHLHHLLLLLLHLPEANLVPNTKMIRRPIRRRIANLDIENILILQYPRVQVLVDAATLRFVIIVPLHEDVINASLLEVVVGQDYFREARMLVLLGRGLCRDGAALRHGVEVLESWSQDFGDAWGGGL